MQLTNPITPPYATRTVRIAANGWLTASQGANAWMHLEAPAIFVIFLKQLERRTICGVRVQPGVYNNWVCSMNS